MFLGDPRPILALPGLLEAAGFTTDGIRAALGSEGNLTPNAADVPVYLRRLPAGTPLTTLMELFVLGTAVDRRTAAAALAPLSVAALHRAGLVSTGPEGVRGRVRLIPTAGFVFACDWLESGSGAVAADHVAGVSASSVHLANLTVRRPGGATLDLGTGCGIEALLASRHADRVVATDVSPRAVEFASFNAVLNDVATVSVRQGSVFEPVAGERFDLIVSNPPFVISPERDLVFRDSGLAGDEFCRELVGALPAHLSEGGFAHVLASWGHRADEHWSEPLRSWVEGLGCDAWFLRTDAQDGLAYAATWNRPPGQVDYGAVLDRWLADYRELGFERISTGAIALRRRAGANWIRADELSADRIGPAGDHVEAIFAAQDYLAGGPDLLDAVFRVVEGHALEQTLHLENGHYEIEQVMLRLTRGLRFQAGVDVFTAQLLARLDGRRTLRDALAETAAELAPDGVGTDEFALAALPAVRGLLELGFLAR